MPGITKTEGRSPNNFVWRINQEHSSYFEDLIFEHLRLSIGTTDGLVTCKQTRRSGDQGRDVEIRARKNINVLGHNIEVPIGRDEIYIYVEIKSTSADRLSAGYLEDYAQVIGERCDVYLLATNATITPYYQYIAQRNWESSGRIFLLSDRWLLGCCLVNSPIVNQFKELGIELPTQLLLAESHDEIVIDYQYEWTTPALCDEGCVDIYLTVRRFEGSSNEVAISLAMVSAQEWRALEDDIPMRGLKANGFIATRMRFKPPLSVESSPLRITVKCGEWRHVITTATKPPAWAVFEPPMIGTEHIKLREKLYDWLSISIIPKVVSITGEAGIGKSRVIKEALKAFVGSRYRVAKFIFSKDESNNNWENFIRDIGCHDTSLPQDLEGQVCSLLKAAIRIPDTILIFEDLHHATAEVIQVFRQAIVEEWLTNTSLRIIVTGRNDSTFPNDEYFSLLALIESYSEGQVLSFSLHKLESNELSNLARAILHDAPQAAIDRIVTLGDGNPFILIQTVQHLLDRNIAVIASRQTVSVLQPELLHRPDSLPCSVLELYDARIKALETVENGRLARRLLGALSFFGFQMPREIYTPLLDGEDGHAIWSLLDSRGFSIMDPHGRRSFAHENLLNQFRAWSLLDENKHEVASFILGEPFVFMKLSVHDQGEIFWLAGKYENAWKTFTDIWERVINITNVSSEQINKSFFSHLDTVIKLAGKLNKPPSKRAKACCALGYMGVHNFPVMIGIESCNRALKYLNEDDLKKNRDVVVARLRIKQLRAHGLQNLGKTSLALQEMLEIEAEAEQIKLIDIPLLFDLNDRLQEYYRKINHRKLSNWYGSKVRSILEKCDDQRLITCNLITESIARLYDGKRVAISAAINANNHAESTGIHRLKVYTRLTVIIAYVLYSQTKEEFCELQQKATVLLKEALLDNLSDSLMRCELLLGTLALFIENNIDTARNKAYYWATLGLNHSSRFGNGLFDWAFYNLLGVINTKGNRFREEARLPFESCLYILHLRGLTFLGAFDGCHPTIYALSNIIRFFVADDWNGEPSKWVIRQLSAYNTDKLAASEFPHIIENVTSGRPLVAPNRPSIPLKLRDPTDEAGKGYFTPLI